MNKPAIHLSNPVQTMSSREIAELTDDEIVSMAFAILQERIKKAEQTEDQAKADERKHWDDAE